MHLCVHVCVCVHAVLCNLILHVTLPQPGRRTVTEKALSRDPTPTSSLFPGNLEMFSYSDLILTTLFGPPHWLGSC